MQVNHYYLAVDLPSMRVPGEVLVMHSLLPFDDGLELVTLLFVRLPKQPLFLKIVFQHKQIEIVSGQPSPPALAEVVIMVPN